MPSLQFTGHTIETPAKRALGTSRCAASKALRAFSNEFWVEDRCLAHGMAVPGPSHKPRETKGAMNRSTPLKLARSKFTKSFKLHIFMISHSGSAFNIWRTTGSKLLLCTCMAFLGRCNRTLLDLRRHKKNKPLLLRSGLELSHRSGWNGIKVKYLK